MMNWLGLLATMMRLLTAQWPESHTERSVLCLRAATTELTVAASRSGKLWGPRFSGGTWVGSQPAPPGDRKMGHLRTKHVDSH